MRDPRFRAIRCTISRGGFSDERVFVISAGGIEYEGIASRRHLWKEDRSPVDEGEPPIGETIDGLVAARILEIQKDGKALVSIPDGEVIPKFPVAELVDRPSGAESNVPV